MKQKINISDKALKDFLKDEKATDKIAAEYFNVSRSTIALKRRRLGISPKSKRPKDYYKITEDQDRQLYSLYQSGKNDYEVASIMHIGRSRLRLWRNSKSIPSKSNKKGLDSSICADVYKKYLEGFSFSEIASEIGVHRSSLIRLLRKNGFLSKKLIRPNPVWTEDYMMTSFQQSVLVGDLFGDGHISRTSDNSACYTCSHAKHQENFIVWKFNALKPLSCRISVGDQKSRTDPNTRIEHISMSTWSSKALIKWWHLFYPNRSSVKVPRQELVKYLDWLALAVWFMGDGSCFRNKARFVLGLDIDADAICEALNKKFGDIFRSKSHKKEKSIYIENNQHFFENTDCHILPLFKYKIPESFKKLCTLSVSFGSVYGNPEFTPQCFKSMPLKDQKILINDAVAYYKSRGFPYPLISSVELKKSFKQLCASVTREQNRIFIGNYLGCNICNHFFLHRYKSSRNKKRPMDIWEDDIKLQKFMWNRFKHFKVPFSDSSIRTGLVLKGLPANFNPSIAKAIYERYPGDVLDFCAGYGGRLLGWMSARTGGSYTGVEPLSDSYSSLLKMTNFFGVPNIEIHQKPFEDMVLSSNQFDLAFSSPPYFKLEEYGSENTQSTIRYPDYNIWLEKFWFISLTKCIESLKSGGHLIFSLSNYGNYNLIKDTTDYLSKLKCHKLDSYYISYHNVFSNTNKLEEIFIYKS